MHRVLTYIDRHLDRPLELAQLAAVAHFSSFHFHRLFCAFTGETLGDYVRRRRLELAAARLAAQPRLSVLSVALSVGFGSSEAFAHAFKARFGCSASAWRRQQSKRDQPQRKPDQALPRALAQDGVPEQRIEESAMKVKVVQRTPVIVAYQRHIGPYGREIGEFWQRIVYPWVAANDLLGRARYGISLDDPGVTEPEKCRYDAGVEVSAAQPAPNGALVATLPGGRYAMTAFHGSSDQIGALWQALLRDWLPQSGMQLDARPFFEYYPIDARYDTARGLFSCELAVPVAPL